MKKTEDLLKFIEQDGEITPKEEIFPGVGYSTVTITISEDWFESITSIFKEPSNKNLEN